MPDMNPNNPHPGLVFDPRIGWYDPIDERYKLDEVNRRDTQSAARQGGQVARAAANKVKKEIAQPQRQPATVIEAARPMDGNAQQVRVHFDDAPQDKVDTVAVSTSSPLRPGDRVWVEGQPPHGVSVTGTMESERVHLIRMTNTCSSPV